MFFQSAPARNLPPPPRAGWVAVRLLGLVGLFALGVLVARAQVVATNALPVIEVNSTKSVFNGDFAFGKDPFFPKSERRRPKLIVEPPPDQPQQTTAADWLKVKGLSFMDGKPLVVILNRNFNEGEEWDLKHDGRTRRVRCLKINIQERTVSVSVDGTVQSIPMNLQF